MTDYQPIACELHSQYELATIQARFVLLEWKNAAEEIQQERLKPVDMLISNREEFLLLEQQDGGKIKIRLDRILNIL